MLDKYNILVIEDNKLVNSLISRTLSKNGAIVDSSFDGIEALEKIKDKNYDLIITDIEMDKMDGLELIKQVREQKLTNCTIIIISENKSENLVIKALELNVFDYIYKPISTKILLLRVYRALNLETPSNEINNSNNEIITINDTFFQRIINRLKSLV